MRKKGSMTLKSISWYLNLLEVGERHYVEMNVDDYSKKAKGLTGYYMHTEPLKSRKFKQTILMATDTNFNTRYLVAIERIA